MGSKRPNFYVISERPLANFRIFCKYSSFSEVIQTSMNDSKAQRQFKNFHFVSENEIPQLFRLKSRLWNLQATTPILPLLHPNPQHPAASLKAHRDVALNCALFRFHSLLYEYKKCLVSNNPKIPKVYSSSTYILFCSTSHAVGVKDRSSVKKRYRKKQ